MVLWLFILLGEAHALRINEVFFDPTGNDNNREFIEIFSEEFVNLSGWIIADSEANDTLIQVQHHSKENEQYALIVEEGFNYSDSNASVYSAGATIGNNLNNNGDEIRLYDPDGTLVANMSYNTTDMSYTTTLNGTSLEYHNGTYRESLVPEGTPNRRNSREDTIENDGGELDKTNETEGTQQEKQETGQETQQMPQEPEEQETCNYLLTVETSKELIQNKEQLQYSFTTIPAAEYMYWIEDLEGNMVRKERTTSSPGQKSFTPSISEKEKIFRIKAQATTENCYFSAEKIIAVTNPFAEEKKTPEPTKKQNTPEKEQQKKVKQPIEYTLATVPEKLTLVNNTATLAFFLDITNNEEPHQFEVWSYVFRGPKSYSGDREKNKQLRAIDAGRTARTPLTNAINATPGEYVLKVKIRKDNQASTIDLARTLLLEAEEKKEANVSDDVKKLIAPPASATAPAAPRVIRRQPATPYLLAGAFFIIAMGMIWVKGA